MPDKLLQKRDAATILGCSQRTLENPNSSFSQRLAEFNAIVRIGRSIRFKESAVLAVVAGRHIAPEK